MKVAIIGAGWYGCHIASKLIANNFDVKIYEQRKDIFLGSSGYNQNRLHLGFHYPRSYITRVQSLEGFKLFCDQYGFLTEKIEKNIFGIAKDRSFIDFETYLQILDASKINYKIGKADNYGLQNLSGVVICDERLILHKEAKRYFRGLLKNNLMLNTKISSIKSSGKTIIINKEEFDFAINCTWYHLLPMNKPNIFYEPFITFRYNSDSFGSKAITVMDGPFFSIYPWLKNIYTLTHVELNPLGQFDKIEYAIRKINKISKNYIINLKEENEKQVKNYLPDFKSIFTYKDYFISYKTKLRNESDPRNTAILYDDRIINVMSGKIDTIFQASEEIIRLLKKY